MKLDLSIFRDRSLERISACGLLHEPPAKLAARMEKYRSFESERKVGRETIWVRVIANTQAPDGIHFHIDAARASAMEDEPESVQPKQFDMLMGAFEDFPIQFKNTKYRFVFPRSAVKPKTLVGLLLGTVVGKLGSDQHEATLTGSRYSMASGPVDEVRWHLITRNKVEMIMANVEADLTEVLTKDVLAKLYEPCSAAFRALILEEGGSWHGME